MALTAQQQNFIGELMAWAEIELRQRATGQNLAARWELNGVLAKLDDASIQALPSFAHLDAQKIIDGVSALLTVNTALGNDVSGQAVNLIKLKG